MKFKRHSPEDLLNRFEKHGLTLRDVALLTGHSRTSIENSLSGKTAVPAHLLVFATLWTSSSKRSRAAAMRHTRREYHWRQIPSYPDYEASNAGEIRRATNSPGAAAGVVLKPFPNRDGYLCVSLPKEGGGQVKIGVHRLVCEAFHGKPPPGKNNACHADSNPQNNVPENLRWGSTFDNAQDRKTTAARRRVWDRRRTESVQEAEKTT